MGSSHQDREAILLREVVRKVWNGRRGDGRRRPEGSIRRGNRGILRKLANETTLCRRNDQPGNKELFF